MVTISRWLSHVVWITWFVADYVSAQDGQAPDVSTDYTIFSSTRMPLNTRYTTSVANGHLGFNVFTDTIYMNGLYNGRLGESHRARVPAMHSSNVVISGESLTSELFSLDTNRGLFEHTMTSPSANVTYRMYAHRFYNRLLVTDVHVDRIGATGTPLTIVRTAITTDINSNDLILNSITPFTEVTSGCGQTSEVMCKQRNGLTVTTETTESQQSPVYYFWNDMPDNFTLGPTQTSATWSYLISVDFVRSVAEENFIAGMQMITNQNQALLLANHTDEWSDIWLRGTVDIEGDATILTLRKIVRGSLYYLYSFLPSQRTFSPKNQFYALSPGGLANGEQGRDYYGHVFWDMETWMYPVMLLVRPDLARDMLAYRINGMIPAFDRATSGNYNGTRFPWESAYTGVEVTPDVCVPCRENQQHITGDIAFAARQYISATRDIAWLTQAQSGTSYTGADFILEMARFWASRPEYNPQKDRYDINGVMPPDEHQQSINNSVYTNVVASLSVHFARYSSCLAGRDPVADVPDSWLSTIQQLVFPFNTARRYHEEYEGYEKDVQNNVTGPDYVKQADVVLLGYPLLWEMPSDVRENDLLEYENVTSAGGPAMTWGMFSVGWLDVGDDVKAASLFDRSYQLYYREPFKVWTEAQQGAGAINFITGMGGFLQALVSGYGGLRLRVEELYFRQPKLPINVTKLVVKNLEYLGNQLNYEVSGSDVTVTAVEADGLPLILYLADGTPLSLDEGVPRTFPAQTFTVNTTVTSGCPLPLDYIEVDYSAPFK